MKTLKNTLLLFCSLLMLSASCKKQSKNPIDNLPPATQTGANTFGCLVNGEVFLPKSRGIGPSGLSCNIVFDNGNYNLYLSARNSGSDVNKNISIKIKNIILMDNSINILNNDTTNRGEYYTINNSLTINSFKTNINNQGTLKINYWDPSKGIISGTFSFDAVNSVGEKVKVREGRFDIKL